MFIQTLTAALAAAFPGSSLTVADRPGRQAVILVPASAGSAPPAPQVPASPTPAGSAPRPPESAAPQVPASRISASGASSVGVSDSDPTPAVKDVLRFLRDGDFEFDQLLDVTAVDYPARNPRFDVVYILVSTMFSHRVRVLTQIEDGRSLPTVSDLWRSADWGERECFDMFGIRFEGHPNLKRILNPDNFYGYPLRKTFPLRGERDPAFLEYKETEPADVGDIGTGGVGDAGPADVGDIGTWGVGDAGPA